MRNILECRCMAVELSIVRSETTPKPMEYKDEYYIWGKSGISPTSGEQMWTIIGIRER
jgi:hypothetical protein